MVTEVARSMVKANWVLAETYTFLIYLCWRMFLPSKLEWSSAAQTEPNRPSWGKPVKCALFCSSSWNIKNPHTPMSRWYWHMSVLHDMAVWKVYRYHHDTDSILLIIFPIYWKIPHVSSKLMNIVFKSNQTSVTKT